MQQRRLRLGDILDDYCPRERRITNHAVVAMIDEQVKQTRCTTCDAEHEYKEARTPSPRKKKDAGVLGDIPDAALRPAVEATDAPDEPLAPEIEPASPLLAADGDEPVDEPSRDDEGPVHRRLIRATLPRPEGQAPEWKEPDFTIRQPGRGGREFDGNRNGHGGQGGQGGQRPGRPRRPMRAGGNGNAGGQRFGGPRQGNPRSGGGAGHGQGQRPPGSRPGGNNRGSGRKRGR